MVSGVRKEAMLALKENNLMKEKNPLYPSAADSFSFKPKDYYSYFVEKVKKVLTKKKKCSTIITVKGIPSNQG